MKVFAVLALLCAFVIPDAVQAGCRRGSCSSEKSKVVKTVKKVIVRK